MPLDCTNIFENLDIEITDEHEEIDTVCVEALRDLAKRDDFNLEVSVLINDKILELCDKINELEENLEVCCGYYDYDLEEFVI